jgi:riboflavin biosynthesis pyrimidine reductase
MTARPSIAPLETLLESRQGTRIALTPRLGRLFGVLRMKQTRGSPRVFSNFVSTLDGVVSLNIKGHEGGGDISGFSGQDRMVMGLLRATADAVIVGGGSLAAEPRRLWAPEAICPELAAEYRTLSDELRPNRAALRVVVSASGKLDLASPAFASGGSPLLIVTSRAGATQLASQRLPGDVEVRAVRRRSGPLAAPEVLEEVCRVAVAARRILVEGGPRLLAGFYAARVIDEQFLTLAPQLAGRKEGDGRIGLVMGEQLAPKTPRWGTLMELRRGANHLFLRYMFDRSRAGRR